MLCDIFNLEKIINTLQRRHNEHHGASKHRHLDCLLKCWYRPRSKKILKLRVTGLCAGNSPVTGEFPAHRTSNAENVSIWWSHHEHFIGMFLICGDPLSSTWWLQMLWCQTGTRSWTVTLLKNYNSVAWYRMISYWSYRVSRHPPQFTIFTIYHLQSNIKQCPREVDNPLVSL